MWPLFVWQGSGSAGLGKRLATPPPLCADLEVAFRLLQALPGVSPRFLLDAWYVAAMCCVFITSTPTMLRT